MKFPLTKSDLENIAGPLVFGRGVEYVPYVHDLKSRASRASARVEGSIPYRVELTWNSKSVTPSCECPHHEGGFFCKHLVAVALVLIKDTSPAVAETDSTIDAYLADLSADDLRGLVRELANRDESAQSLLRTRAAAGTGDTAQLADALTATVNNVLGTRSFIDYKESFAFAHDADELLNELEIHLGRGCAPDAAEPALRRATTLLRRIMLRADDSAGVLGTVCQRAADLHARSCRKGNPDGVKLARWLVKFRDESPGWPDQRLSDYAPAFDRKALDAYRKAVAAVAKSRSGGDWLERHEVERMLLELADHDGDVDAAIAVLSGSEQVAYGKIIARLRRAGRHNDVVEWVDKAVAAGRIGDRPYASEYWLDAAEIATVYYDADRASDGLAVLVDAFKSSPGAGTFQQLLDYADRVGQRDKMRSWALALVTKATSKPRATGATLIEIALHEHDVDAAWVAARAHGAGGMWEALAKASAKSHPREAGDLYRVEVERDLVHANTRVYPQVARNLVAMRKLYGAAGSAADFERYLDALRDKYRRRTSLLSELYRARL
ncbi:SWIM zinc finger domain-containing protein [Antrihabitans sp. NCIMB 15449]|uniref:SWIM zinc finger domain-containing protein n=1 Tax=Antrihabitans spumae TaxID=3373370 RepID=A0ABW7JRQ4_9NOCA